MLRWNRHGEDKILLWNLLSSGEHWAQLAYCSNQKILICFYLPVFKYFTIVPSTYIHNKNKKVILLACEYTDQLLRDSECTGIYMQEPMSPACPSRALGHATNLKVAASNQAVWVTDGLWCDVWLLLFPHRSTMLWLLLIKWPPTSCATFCLPGALMCCLGANIIFSPTWQMLSDCLHCLWDRNQILLWFQRPWHVDILYGRARIDRI